MVKLCSVTDQLSTSNRPSTKTCLGGRANCSIHSLPLPHPLGPPPCLDATDRGQAGTPPCMFISNKRPLLHRVLGEGAGRR